MGVYNPKKKISGGGGNRTRVLLSLPIKDYMLRSGFFTPSELFGFYFAIVTNNCGVFTQIGRTPNMTSIPFKVETTP